MAYTVVGRAPGRHQRLRGLWRVRHPARAVKMVRDIRRVGARLRNRAAPSRRPREGAAARGAPATGRSSTSGASAGARTATGARFVRTGPSPGEPARPLRARRSAASPVNVGHRFEQVQIEMPADDRGRREDLVRFAGNPPQPPADDRPDAGRHVDSVDLESRRQRPVRVEQASLLVRCRNSSSTKNGFPPVSSRNVRTSCAGGSRRPRAASIEPTAASGSGSSESRARGAVRASWSTTRVSG